MTPGAATPPRAPLSTYRFQFNHQFTFRDATAQIDYLRGLGIDWVYASPYLQARPGSMHGYDIANHNRLNPEIGTPEEHEAMIRAIRRHGMGHLLDIVPNHMGIGQPENEWWMDVLENGPSSVYGPYFDIDWEPLKPELAHKVLLPVLGDQFGRVLERGELKLRYDEGTFRIDYFDKYFPVAPRSRSLVLRAALERLSRALDADHPDRIELESIAAALEHLPPHSSTEPASVAERKRENLVSRRRVRELHEASEPFRDALAETIAEFNGREGEPHSFDQLERLLNGQAYRLAFWRVAAEEINYRRFFDINELAGVRVERGEVFQATHRLILQLVAEGKVDGLRIDHPDGLFHPHRYLRDLQAESARRVEGSSVYVVVEKILTGEEPLREEWPVAGTVGYEFLNRLNGLFVASANEAEMTRTYHDFIGRDVAFNDLVYEKKLLILRTALVSELNVLSYLLDRISEQNRRFRDFTLGSLRDALAQVVASFPVYRTYIDAEVGRVTPGDEEYVNRAIRIARRRNPYTNWTVYEFIRNILLLHWPDDLDEESREQHARFVMKFQQLTGPVMAKGLEDTTFYIYNRLVSLNEVGGEPARFGISPEELHLWLAERGARWPHALNATSTHDTKRSEDVRARINVLSERPAEWRERVTRWAELNRALKLESEDGAIPTPNDEYLLYQTLVGAWPLGEQDEEDRARFVERMQQYMEKATREAKVHTSWINPNEEYDTALREFVAAVLANRAFLDDFLPFQRRVARVGMLNSISQTLVKLTCPGVPDVYQGQEVWDFSLVDPDNRRPVDYALRARRLEELVARRGEPGAARATLDAWTDGSPKLLVTHTALALRLRAPELFGTAAYLPLTATGPRGEQVFAFARHHGDRALLVVAPRLWGSLAWDSDGVPGGDAWEGTDLVLEGGVPTGRYRDLLGGAEVEVAAGGSLPLARVLGDFPAALLERVAE